MEQRTHLVVLGLGDDLVHDLGVRLLAVGILQHAVRVRTRIGQERERRRERGRTSSGSGSAPIFLLFINGSRLAPSPGPSPPHPPASSSWSSSPKPSLRPPCVSEISPPSSSPSSRLKRAFLLAPPVRRDWRSAVKRSSAFSSGVRVDEASPKRWSTKVEAWVRASSMGRSDFLRCGVGGTRSHESQHAHGIRDSSSV